MVVGTRRGARGGGTGGARGRGRAGTKSSAIAQQEAEPSEYERQREERVKENRAKLKALGLRGLASALGVHKEEGKDDDGKRERRRAAGKGKGRAGMEDDEDYRPDDDGPSSSSSDSERSGEDEGKRSDVPSGRPTPKKKAETPRKRSKSSAAPSRAATPKKKLSFRDTQPAGVSEPDIVADEEAALQQAIALSLGEAPDHFPALNDAPPVTSPRGNPAQVSGKGKRRKQGPQAPPRAQITEDEVGAYFFTFDQAGKGHITVRDLQKMALANDFCWEDEEMADMIYLFDADGSGKLNYGDFHKILSRCNMVQVSKVS